MMLPNQVDFDALLDGRIEKATLDAVRNLKGDWDGSCKEVVKLRAEMLKALGRRCFYCRRNIQFNEVGLREMDHILPKSQSPTRNFQIAIATSNEFGVRRHTRGYPQFKYEPRNLVICCKRCNSFKGTFDPLRNRYVDLAEYPTVGEDFIWIHPFFDIYDDHVEIQGGGIYIKKNNSDKGEAVIRACGLDKSEELTKRIVEDYVNSHMELTHSMLGLVISGPFDVAEVAKNYSNKFGVADAETMELCLNELMSSMAAGVGSIARALDSVKKCLGTEDPIYAPVTR